jgi:hypothetical protein
MTQGTGLRGVPAVLPAGTRLRASSDASVSATDGMLAVRRAVLWALLASKMLSGWGVRWDIQWHVRIGRDSFWIPPHLMTYTGVSLVVLLSFGVLFWETYAASATGSGRGPGTMRILGLTGTRGYHIAAWGISVTVMAAPIDDLWHRLFGLDVTIWSPPHLMGFLGGLLNTVGCLLIALESYPGPSLAGVGALTVAGAWLHGSLNLVLEPANLVAYQHGGVRFYTYVILATLLLPLALVGTPRLTGRRWTPIALLLVVAASALVGGQIARAGFAWLQPVSVIDQEIVKDPTSPIALAHEIARKNGTTPGDAGFLILMALVPAAVIVAVDPRRRPVAATMSWAVALFAIYGRGLAGSPAFRPMAPDAAATAIALSLTLAAAALGGLAARRLSDHLAARASGSG